MELPLTIYLRRMPHWIPFVILFELLLGLAAILFPVYFPFILVIGTAGLLLFLIRPELCYYLTILALGFDGISIIALKGGGGPGAQTINAHHILILIGFVTILIKIMRDKLEIQRSSLEVPVFLFLAWAMISLLWTPNLRASLVVVVQIFVALALFFSSTQFFREEKFLRSVVMIWFFLGLADAFLTFLFPHGYKFSPFVGLQWTKSVLGRALAFTGHPNTLALQLNVGILLGFGLLLSAKSRLSKWLYGLAIIPMSLAFVLTMSRGWLVALPIGIAFFFYRMRQFKKFIIVIIAGLVLIGILFLILPESLQGIIWRFFRAPSGAEYSDIEVAGAGKTLEVRSLLWEAGFEFFKNTYGRGIGAGGFASVVGGVLPESAEMQLHSLYFTIIFELGFVGIVIFFWLLVRLLIKIELFSKQIRETSVEPLFLAWYAGWVTMLLNGFLRITLGSVPFWSFMSLGIIIMKIGVGQRKNA